METVVAGEVGAKAQLTAFFAAARQLRVPLLVMNSLIIVIELAFG